MLKYAFYGKENSLGNAVISSECIVYASDIDKLPKKRIGRRIFNVKTSTNVIQSETQAAKQVVVKHIYG